MCILRPPALGVKFKKKTANYVSDRHTANNYCIIHHNRFDRIFVPIEL